MKKARDIFMPPKVSLTGIQYNSSTPMTITGMSINFPQTKYKYIMPAGNGSNILTCDMNERPNLFRRVLQWIVCGATWEKNPNYKGK